MNPFTLSLKAFLSSFFFMKEARSDLSFSTGFGFNHHPLNDSHVMSRRLIRITFRAPFKTLHLT